MNAFDLEPSSPEQPVAQPREEDGHEALVRIAPQLAQLTADELLQINVDIPRACAIVTGALPKVASLRAAIADELPRMPLATIDQLGDATMALFYAHLMTTPRPRSPERLAAVYAEVIELRAEMYEQAKALARRKLLEARKVADIQAGSGYLDMAGDVIALSLMFRQNWSAVSNKTVVTREDCERADRIGRELLHMTAAGLQPTLDGLTMDDARDRRARYFTLFVRAYWFTRQAVSHLRWWQGDANLYLPSIFTRSGPRKKARAAAEKDAVAMPRPSADGSPISSPG